MSSLTRHYGPVSSYNVILSLLLLWLSSMIRGVASQADEEKSGSQTSNKQKDLIVILVFFGALILATVGIIAFYVVRYRTQEPELRLLDQLNIQKEVEHLAENMVAQLKVLLRIPWRQPRRWRWNDWASWLLLGLFMASGVALIIGVALPDTDTDDDGDGSTTSRRNKQTFSNMSGRSLLMLLSTFALVMSVNLFLIARQHLYYKCKGEAYANDARFRAISETSFGSFDRASWYNRIQILVLVFEFFQLISFPLRDLLRNDKFHATDTDEPNNATKFVDAVIRIVALLPQLSSVYFYVQYWTITGGVIIGLCVAFLFHLHNKYARVLWPIFWVSSVVPIVGVLYLPVMTTYINSVACLTKHAHESLISTQRCPPPSTYYNFYLLFSLIFYIIAYFFLTVFLTSYDRTPIKGDITFKSSGVAFFDNLDMLLVIDFLLLPDDDTRLRGILSIIILLALVCYNISMRPCYVRPVNYWRTASLCCILWTALLVPILNDKDLNIDINAGIIAALMIVGWLVIFLFFVFVRYCYRSEPYDPELETCSDKDTSTPSHHRHSTQHRLITAMNSFQSLITGRSSHHNSKVDLTATQRRAASTPDQQQHPANSTSNNLLSVESALERAMSRARPPPWKDPWAPLPPYYRQYQASTRRRRHHQHRNTDRRTPIGIANASNYYPSTTNESTDPHSVMNQRRARTQIDGVYEETNEEMHTQTSDPIWATLHPNYQARMSVPDIPTFILQEEQQQQQQQQQLANHQIIPMPEPYDGHGFPQLTILDGPLSSEPWPSNVTEITLYPPAESQELSTNTTATQQDASSTPVLLPGSMHMPSATLHRQQVLASLRQPTSGTPLGRSRSRSMPGPPTWLTDLHELSRLTERTENPDDTMQHSSIAYDISNILA